MNRNSKPGGRSGERCSSAIPAFCRPKAPDVVARQLEAYRYRINLHQTLEALRAAGAESVTVDVRGWGSALEVEDIRFEPENVDGAAHGTVCVLTEPQEHDGEVFSTYGKRDLTLAEAAKEVVTHYAVLTERTRTDGAHARRSVVIAATADRHRQPRTAVH